MITHYTESLHHHSSLDLRSLLPSRRKAIEAPESSEPPETEGATDALPQPVAIQQREHMDYESHNGLQRCTSEYDEPCLVMGCHNKQNAVVSKNIGEQLRWRPSGTRTWLHLLTFLLL